MSIICCFLFASCQKDGGETNTGEDLSYLIKTYFRYDNGGRIIKQTWTYDGYQLTGYQAFEDGQLYSESKNYLYNGLRCSYDSYSYRIGNVDDVTIQHIECEYLDNTYQKIKYKKSYYPNSQNTNIIESYSEYDGKKLLSTKSYVNGVLSGETVYYYEGLTCNYQTTGYYSGGIEERNFVIVYLDDTYLREKSRMQTRLRYDSDGNLASSNTFYTVNDYDGKKPIGYQWYRNGKLSAVGRDYQYDGLTCYYYIDSYNNDGEVVSTSLYEVEYLK